MANSNYNFRVSAAGPNPVVAGDKRLTLRNVIRLFTAILNSQRPRASDLLVDIESSAVAASGTIELSSSEGTLTATINGVAVTADGDGTDAENAAALAAAINASSNALVKNHVTATSEGDVVTITAKVPGHAGNAITLAASGTGATASGTRLEGGTGTSNSFTF